MLGMDAQDAQKSRPTRPQSRKIPEAYPLGYVEDFFEARTKLEAFFSILSHERRQRRIGDRMAD